VISPLALKAVRRIDALFEIERSINGETPEWRQGRPPGAQRAVGRRSETWMREQHTKLSRRNDLANYGRHARTLECVHTFRRRQPHLPVEQRRRTRRAWCRLGWKFWLFCGSDRAAAMYSLMVTAEMNDADPQAWPPAFWFALLHIQFINST
jgi:hypothetical protein